MGNHDIVFNVNELAFDWQSKTLPLARLEDGELVSKRAEPTKE